MESAPCPVAAAAAWKATLLGTVHAEPLTHSMLHRLIFLCLGVFCATMHVLLWRSEYAPESGGAPIPLELVWNKILTAPDNSSLEMRRQGSKIGFCRWIPNVGGETATGKTADGELEPDGMVRVLSNYTLDLEGNVTAGEASGRFRFHAHLEFAAHHSWKSLAIEVGEKKSSWEIKSSAADRKIKVSYFEGRPVFEHTLSFDDLRNPQKLLADLDLPWMPLISAALPQTQAPPASGEKAWVAMGLQWDCRQDWLRFGHSRMRTYRLKGRILDKYAVVLHVSRVGEILRAELPGDILLINEAIAGF